MKYSLYFSSEGASSRRLSQYKCVKRGRAASLSEWYELCSDPESENWAIEDSSVVLPGNQQCDAWSECKQTLKDPRKVCWQFRMQGHGEQTGGLSNQGNAGIPFSTGILSVLWKH
jgi:hypothetical protein